jgi:type IX secretion system substrate protein
VGLDFGSDSPVGISTSINTGEGCASVCDPLGGLLFYSNGKIVYNKTGAVMPAGTAIVSYGTLSSEQAALIIPVIGSTNQYYLFSLGGAATLNYNRISYSIVDMTLDGGLGDVVAASMGTMLVDSLGENMIAIAGNNNNIWLITHRRDTAVFLAYSITATGISAPVKSALGIFNGGFCYLFGMLRESPNRRKIAQGVYKVGQCYGTLLYDFDPSTGIVSNCIEIDTSNDAVYGVEFSPDNTKLYSNGAQRILQYNISLASSAAIQTSKYLVTDSSDGADLRLGPNGKIYFRNNYTGSMDCISAPNLSESDCSYVSHAVIFSESATFETYPNLYVTTDTANRVGVNELTTFHAFSMYPNPASTSLTIKSPIEITSVVISDLLGQTMCRQQYSSPQIQVDVADLPAGVYLIRINDTEVRKFVKE